VAERLRFEDEDRVVAVAGTWTGVDYLLLTLIEPDGSERQVLRRNLGDEGADEVVADLPAALRADEPQKGRLYGMERGGRRLGKTAVRLVPDVVAEAEPVVEAASEAEVPDPADEIEDLRAEFERRLEFERDTSADLGADLAHTERRLAAAEDEVGKLRGRLADKEADLTRKTSELRRARRHAAGLEREIAEAVEVLEAIAANG